MRVWGNSGESIVGTKRWWPVYEFYMHSIGVGYVKATHFLNGPFWSQSPFDCICIYLHGRIAKCKTQPHSSLRQSGRLINNIITNNLNLQFIFCKAFISLLCGFRVSFISDTLCVIGNHITTYNSQRKLSVGPSFHSHLCYVFFKENPHPLAHQTHSTPRPCCNKWWQRPRSHSHSPLKILQSRDKGQLP